MKKTLQFKNSLLNMLLFFRISALRTTFWHQEWWVAQGFGGKVLIVVLIHCVSRKGCVKFLFLFQYDRAFRVMEEIQQGTLDTRKRRTRLNNLKLSLVRYPIIPILFYFSHQFSLKTFNLFFCLLEQRSRGEESIFFRTKKKKLQKKYENMSIANSLWNVFL